MFMFHESADVPGWWGKWVHMQSEGKEMNAYRHSLHCLVQYMTKGNYPAFCQKDFCVIFVNSSFMLMSVFNSTVQSVPCQSNNRSQVRQCRHLNHVLGFRRCWVCCTVSFVEVYSVAWLQRENLQTKASWKWHQNQPLDTHSSEYGDISYPEWQTHWEWHDITDTNCTLTIQIAGLKYLQSTVLQGIPVDYNKQKHSRSLKTGLQLVFLYSSFLRLHSCWWNRQTDFITRIWTHWTMESLHCLMWLFKKFVFGNYLADGAWSEG